MGKNSNIRPGGTFSEEEGGGGRRGKGLGPVAGKLAWEQALCLGKK